MRFSSSISLRFLATSSMSSCSAVTSCLISSSISNSEASSVAVSWSRVWLTVNIPYWRSRARFCTTLLLSDMASLSFVIVIGSSMVTFWPE